MARGVEGERQVAREGWRERGADGQRNRRGEAEESYSYRIYTTIKTANKIFGGR